MENENLLQEDYNNLDPRVNSMQIHKTVIL